MQLTKAQLERIRALCDGFALNHNDTPELDPVADDAIAMGARGYAIWINTSGRIVDPGTVCSPQR